MICVCINDKNFDHCLKLAQQYELAEVRIDLCEMNLEQVEQIFKKGKKLIATCRPEYVSDEKRAELLKKAINSGAAYVDLEFESSYAFKSDLIATAQKKGCEVIISYHNFKETPSLQQLKIIVDQSFAMGADVAKLACLVSDPQDNARILALYEKGKRIVSIGMGEVGKISRIAAPFLGAEFTFASINEENATAPGQVIYEDMIKLEQLINNSKLAN